MSAGGGTFGHPSHSHHPPTRDAASLKYVLYGPGHEKFPSWPIAAAAEVPVAIKTPPTGGSQRSKSWTDHTNYPKEQVVGYTRLFMKRNNQSYPQQLKTVLERCEKKPFDSMQYMPTMDHRKCSISSDYNSSSPPERDHNKRDVSKMTFKDHKESITPLTQADLEEYTKKFDEPTLIQHQKQSSYAQSEGYHSYVSSSDLSSTPFIDSLRRDIDASVASMSRVPSWDGDSIVTTRSGSVSSSETLKWHGSLSDMSDVSNSSGTSPRQLIVHSARVQTPQKQNSESVLYMACADRSLPHRTSLNILHQHRLMQQHNSSPVFPSPVAPRKTVAECINIYEGKNIKAIQKKALLSFYERHQDQMKKEAASYHPRQSSDDSPLNKRMLPQSENNTAESGIKCDSPNSIFQGPVIMGPSISLDEWVPERPPKNRNLLMSMSSESKPRRLPSPDILPPPPSNESFKSDDLFPPPPDALKEAAPYTIRTTADGYITNYDNSNSQINHRLNIPLHRLRDMPLQPLIKPSNTLPRKFPNPYIKSTNMKYDKVDKVPSKLMPNHTSIQIECEVPQNAQGQFRAEPIKLCKPEYVDINKMAHNPSLKSPDNIVGRFRAEPLNVHNVKSDENVSKDYSAINSSMSNLKIHRTMSENNHSMTNQASIVYNHFSKSVPQNQSIRRICNPLIAKPNHYSRQESLEKVDQVENVPKTNHQPVENFKDVQEVPIKDNRPPLPEKKRSLPKPVETKPLLVEEVEPKQQPPIEEQKIDIPSIEEPLLPPPPPIEPFEDPKQLIEEEKPIEESHMPVPIELPQMNNYKNIIEHLCPRKHLSEENMWENLRQHLLLTLPDNFVQILLSEYDEYDKTAQLIVDVFSADVTSLITMDKDNEENTEDKIKNTVFINDTVNSMEKEDVPIEMCEMTLNKDKTKVSECLQVMITALEGQELVLESKMELNEKLGASIVAALEKPLSTRVTRLMTDIGLITSLISSLTSRYNRISKTLTEISLDSENKNILELEKGRLTEKLDDAKSLKKSIDNSRAKLFSTLQTELRNELIHDYKFFISMKIKLVIYMRDVKDRIDLAKRLVTAINQDQMPFSSPM